MKIISDQEVLSIWQYLFSFLSLYTYHLSLNWKPSEPRLHDAPCVYSGFCFEPVCVCVCFHPAPWFSAAVGQRADTDLKNK